MPIEVEVYTVPHFKAQVNGKVEPWWLKCASSFSIQTSLLKIGCLLRKSGFVETQSFTTLCGFFAYVADKFILFFRYLANAIDFRGELY